MGRTEGAILAGTGASLWLGYHPARRCLEKQMPIVGRASAQRSHFADRVHMTSTAAARCRI